MRRLLQPTGRCEGVMNDRYLINRIDHLQALRMGGVNNVSFFGEKKNESLVAVRQCPSTGKVFSVC